MRYQHLLVPRSQPLEKNEDPKPELIRDFLAYNSDNGDHPNGTNWVGDLIVECTVKVEAMKGTLSLELSKSADRFWAEFDLQKQTIALMRQSDGGQPEELASTASGISGPGTYKLRFANVDSRLTVWVDEKLPFKSNDRKDGGVDYLPWIPADASSAVMTAYENNKNNLQPASIGASGGAEFAVSHLQLWRNTYYTTAEASAVRTMFVQPGHYLCLGDNSTQSSDGREWGLVPQRLLLGRALLVYYPFWPFGPNRAGPIR